MSKLTLPKLSGDRLILWLVLLIPTFGPAGYSGYKWWVATEGVDRFVAVGLVAFFEVSLAFGLGIYLDVRRSGQTARARGLLCGLAFSALVSGLMLYQPMAGLAQSRFPRPVAPDTTAAKVELAAVDRLERGLQDAVASRDGLAIQAAVAAAGGGIGQHGFDGIAGEDTSAAYTAAFTSLGERRIAAEQSLAEASSALRAGRLWDGLVAIGVLAVLMAVIFARWLLTGVAEGRRPQEVADIRPGPWEVWDPTFNYTYDGWVAAGKPEVQPPEGKHFVPEAPRQGRAGRVYIKAPRRKATTDAESTVH